MKKLKKISLLVLIMWIHSVFAYQSQSGIPNIKYYSRCVTVENNSNDTYTVKYILVPNKSGNDWTDYNLHSQSSQPFCYNDLIYHGISFEIVRYDDGYEFFNGRKSDGTITIPADLGHS